MRYSITAGTDALALLNVVFLLCHLPTCTAPPGKLRVATCVETYPPFVIRNEEDGSLNGFEIDQVRVRLCCLECALFVCVLTWLSMRIQTSQQWQYIYKLLITRVALRGDPVARELVGTEPAPLLQLPMFHPEEAIDALINDVADVVFCG